MPSCETISPGIFIYEDIFEPSIFLNQLFKTHPVDFDCKSWESTHYSKEDSGLTIIKKNQFGVLRFSIDRIYHENNEEINSFKREWLKIQNKIIPTVYDYIKKINIYFDPHNGYRLSHEGYRVLRVSREESIHHRWSHRDTSHRMFGMVAYLNDDCDGEGINFPLFNCNIKSKPGSIVFFPSNYPYSYDIGEAAKEETTAKYILVNWFNVSGMDNSVVDSVGRLGA